MSDFKTKLSEEIKKRRSKKTAPTETDDQQKTKTKSFSFLSFFIGLFLCTCIVGGLSVWAYFKADTTQMALIEKLPSKTAIVEYPNQSIASNQTQTVLTMPEIKEEPETPAEEPPQTKQPTSEEPNTEKITTTEKTTAPIDTTKLMEATSYGIIPKVDEATGAKAFKAYQASFKPKTQKPLLSIIIADLGLSRSKTEAIIENFPKEINLSFSPYSKDLKTLTDTAIKDGHEVWLTLPLETKRYPLNDPGPSTLLINASTEQNQARLHTVLASTNKYVGVTSQPDHAFRAEDATVNKAIKEIFDRGLAMVDSNVSLKSFVSNLAERNNYPYAQNNLWLDENLSPISINQNLRRISEYGEANKNTIVFLRPYPASIKAIQKFLNSKAADAFELAPVSAQLKNND